MNALKELPQIDKILRHPEFKGKISAFLAKFARDELKIQRENLLQTNSCDKFEDILKNIKARYDEFEQNSLQSVINATGVVVHTNLGRSVIDEEILNRTKSVITGYSNLEYSLKNGSRSNRYDYVGSLLAELFGFEDAIVVNNNASAVFLVLNTFAKGGEAIISRGELVEIGGSFRVPEVMANAGVNLREVGTTNKTHLSDYENAICEQTKMILKVHRSNFDIVGFSEDVAIDELSNLAKKHSVVDYYDLGSGYVGELAYNLGKNEPPVREFSSATLVSFSGDKLFGSAQCGIILGKREFIAKLRQNQLLRMLRVDKVIIAILCESIKAYMNREFKLITTLNLIFKSTKELENLAERINLGLKKPLEVIKTTTFVGGGTMPNKKIPSIALKICGNANLLEQKFRAKNIIGRIENKAFLLDLRAILPKDEQRLISSINEILGGCDE